MKPVITVDFDLTLANTTTSWNGWMHLGSDGPLSPIKAVHDLVRDKHAEGHEIHIVTFREEKHKREVLDFVKEYNLPIKSIICTGGQSKTPVLKSLGSQLHIDDSLEVCVCATMEGIDVLFVDCGQLTDGTQKELARSLNTIRVELD